MSLNWDRWTEREEPSDSIETDFVLLLSGQVHVPESFCSSTGVSTRARDELQSTKSKCFGQGDSSTVQLVLCNCLFFAVSINPKAGAA